MISLSAPMCVPSNTVPSSKIKNAFILSSHSAAFATFVFLSVTIPTNCSAGYLQCLRYLRIAPLSICIVYDTHELLRWVSALSTIPMNCSAKYLQCLRYPRIAPLGICNIYDTYELLRCFAALAILKTFGFHCILMFYDLNRHLPPRASTVGLCRLNLVSA